MISKTSFFNKGIYKETVKRFSPGALLYFVLLFISTVLSLFLNLERDFSHMPADYFRNYPVILHGAYITVPVLLSIAVPTVVALLVFHFVHAKKAALFVHSLPAARGAIFGSSLLAAFTLMFLPVLINGALLCLLSLSCYGSFFTLADCLLWMGYNLVALFLLFSVATLAALLTGNGFAAVAVNVLLHSVLFLLVAAGSMLGEVFLFGFSGADALFETLAENNFVVFCYGFMDHYFRENITAWDFVKFIDIAVLFYVLAFLLYRKRRMEAVGDVAAFGFLRPVFKYLITFLVTSAAFAVFSSYMLENTPVFILILALAALFSYAACEMILKKTRNVLYAYKGFLGFLASFSILACLFAFTPFFGYETRVPDEADISSASIYHYYYRDAEPRTKDPAIIEEILASHRSLLENVPKTRYEVREEPYYTRIHIRYTLQNGKTLARAYEVPDSVMMNIMNRLYENDAYKMLCEEAFVEDRDIIRVHLGGGEDIENYDALLAALRKDVLALSYEDLHPSIYNSWDTVYHVEIEFVPTSAEGTPRVWYAHISITNKFTNTMAYLRENEQFLPRNKFVD